MRKLVLIFSIFLFSFPLWGQIYNETELKNEVKEEETIKGQLLTGLDQLEDLMMGMQRSLFSLQRDVDAGQQIIQDMTSIQEAQAMFLTQLRSQLDEMDKLDKAKSQYIILLQSRQQNYRMAMAIGFPVGVLVGVIGGYFLFNYIK